MSSLHIWALVCPALPLPNSNFCLKDGYHLPVTVKISLYEVLLGAFHSPFVINKKQLIYWWRHCMTVLYLKKVLIVFISSILMHNHRWLGEKWRFWQLGNILRWHHPWLRKTLFNAPALATWSSTGDGKMEGSRPLLRLIVAFTFPYIFDRCEVNYNGNAIFTIFRIILCKIMLHPLLLCFQLPKRYKFKI